MQAAIQERYGSPEVLELHDVDAPTLGDDQILVEVHASPVTQGDRRLRAADYPGVLTVLGRLFSGILRPRHRTPGSMFAGRVVAVGPAVTRYAVGDRLFGEAGHGAYAELLVLSETAAMAPIPEGVGYDEAAAAPYGAGTALTFLRGLAGVQPGERVLVVGAAGGVGRYAVQVARHLGAEVTAVCRSEQFELVRGLGADHVIDYRQEDFAKGGERYDVVFDTADTSSFSHARPALTAKGRYLTLALSFRVLAQMAWTRLRKGPRALFAIAMGSPESMAGVAELLAEDKVRPVIAARFPLARIVDAHAAIDARTASGDLVVQVRPLAA